MRYHRTPRYRMKLFASSIAAILLSASATAEEPDELPEDTWVSLTGKVESVEDDQFMLDYGEGEITVDMNNWANFGEAFPLIEGDQVTVYGEVDDRLFLEDRIEASSVHVEGLHTFFYATAADEKELGHWLLDTTVDFGDLTYIGTVESVSPATESFTIDTGARELTVFTATLPHDPLDEEGFQQVEPGNRVSVTGDVNADFFGDADLFADNIVTLSS